MLFGSFVRGGLFRDIDLMVAMEGGRPPGPGELLHLAQLLEQETGHAIDMLGVDVPGVLLRAAIAREGWPIVMNDPELWERFRFQAWIEEMDFRPLVESFYTQRFGLEQRQTPAPDRPVRSGQD